MTTATKPTNGHAPPALRPDVGVLESVLVGGDLSKLNTADRLAYYRMRCDAAGVDPRTQPFAYIVLNNKLVLYATRACTDQLIASRKLGVEIVDRRYDAQLGIYEARARVKFPDGHTVENVAAVSLAGLKGEALCNGVMKTITKAIRRTVLSACGLGALDETEVETISDARPAPPAPAPPVPRPSPRPRPAPEPPPDPEPDDRLPALAKADIDDFFARLQDGIDRVENDWKMTCAIAKKDHVPLGARGRRITPWQVCNGLCKGWIDAGVLNPDDIHSGGKWDQRKALAVVLAEFTNPESVGPWDEVHEYLRSKVDAAALAAGINPDSEPAPRTGRGDQQ